MLERAASLCPQTEFSVGSGERSGLPSGEFDAVTIGSAFHWMRAEEACREVLRLLSPGGLLLVYEYQFPKARGFAELNEWIRREFNLRWKAPGQKPRGDFVEVTARFRAEPRLELLDDRRVPMVQRLDAGQLTGLLLSQSRVLHYEAGMGAGERADFQRWLGERIAAQLPGNGDEFDFGLQAALFGLR
jgi:SAM-dependent methyltransferase